MMWNLSGNKNKKGQEEILSKLYLKEHGYQDYSLISDGKQEKPDAIFDTKNNGKIGIEITILTDEWAMKEHIQKGQARVDRSIGHGFTSDNNISKKIQEIIEEKANKSFINCQKDMKKFLVIYNNCSFASAKSIRQLKGKIDKAGLDEIGIRIEYESVSNDPPKNEWIDL